MLRCESAFLGSAMVLSTVQDVIAVLSGVVVLQQRATVPNKMASSLQLASSCAEMHLPANVALVAMVKMTGEDQALDPQPAPRQGRRHVVSELAKPSVSIAVTNHFVVAAVAQVGAEEYCIRQRARQASQECCFQTSVAFRFAPQANRLGLLQHFHRLARKELQPVEVGQGQVFANRQWAAALVDGLILLQA